MKMQWTSKLTLKNCDQVKFYLVYIWNEAILFSGETSFFSQFFINITDISAQIQKPTKYYSIIALVIALRKLYRFFLVFE